MLELDDKIILENKMRDFNKYNLTLDEIKKMKVNPIQLRNYIEESKKGTKFEKMRTSYMQFNGVDSLGYNEFHMKVFEGKLGNVDFYSDYGMTKYIFNDFFDFDEITKENIYDIEIQEKFLQTINRLIDFGVLYNERIARIRRLDKAMDILDNIEESPIDDILKERPKLENGNLIITDTKARFIVFGGIGYSLATKKPVIFEEDIDNNYYNTKNPALSIKIIYKIPMDTILKNINNLEILLDAELIYEREELTVIQGKYLNGIDKAIFSWIDVDDVAKDAEIGDFAIVEKKGQSHHIEITSIAKTKKIDDDNKVLKLIKIER